MRLTGEQALALHDLIEGPLMNADITIEGGHKAIEVSTNQDQWLIHSNGHVSVADEDRWKSWEAA